MVGERRREKKRGYQGQRKEGKLKTGGKADKSGQASGRKGKGRDYVAVREKERGNSLGVSGVGG